MDDHYDNKFIFEPNPLEDIEAMPLPHRRNLARFPAGGSPAGCVYLG
jgi:hypothetical protein